MFFQLRRPHGARDNVRHMVLLADSFFSMVSDVVVNVFSHILCCRFVLFGDDIRILGFEKGSDETVCFAK
jgi:hypothetical protein